MKLNFLSLLLITGLTACFSSCSSSKKTSAKPATSASSSPMSTPGGIQLRSGQKISALNVSSSDVDMSMGMSMKNNTTANLEFNILSADDSTYKITNTVTKMNMSMDMMGQSTTYDSEKAEDANSEIGKGLAGRINKPDTFSVNRITGHTRRLSKRAETSEIENPMISMMESLGNSNNSDPSLESAFFILPTGKKVGDSWTDSSTLKTIRSVKNYTITAMTNNIATVGIKSTTSGTGDIDVQGANMTYTIDSKNTGEMTVDTGTNRVSKVTTVSDVNMTMEVMGQTMPMTSKITNTTTYQ